MNRSTQVQPNQLIQLCTRTRHVQPIKIPWVWMTDGDPCSRKLVHSNQDKSEKAQETNANSSMGSHSKIKSVHILIKVSIILPWPNMQALLCLPGNGKAYPTFLQFFSPKMLITATCYLDFSPASLCHLSKGLGVVNIWARIDKQFKI